MTPQAASAAAWASVSIPSATTSTLIERAISIIGSYVGSLPDLKELMALVKAGKVQPIPVTERPLARVAETLDDLRAGKVVGRVVLTN